MCKVTYNRSSQKSALNVSLILANANNNKKAQLSLINPRDAKACQKLLQRIRRVYNVVADNTGLSSFV